MNTLRTPKIRVNRRFGATCPEALAQALTEYLLGRTDTPPTIRINSPKEAS